MKPDSDETSKPAIENTVEFNEIFDKIVFQDGDTCTLNNDNINYGRISTATCYNYLTGKRTEKRRILDKILEVEKNGNMDFGKGDTAKETDAIPQSFIELYDNKMPKYFEYRSSFPEIQGISTLFFDQSFYKTISNTNMQTTICAALNSKQYTVICIGVDAYKAVTGVEMSAVDRVMFRMSLKQALAEFEPSIENTVPKMLDTSDLSSNVDVIFIPVINVRDDIFSNRFLLVVRIKEICEGFYQISPGRTNKEKESREIEFSDLNYGFHNLLAEQSLLEIKERRESMFMLEKCAVDSANILNNNNEKGLNTEENTNSERSLYKSLLSHLNIEHFSWLLLGSAVSFCLYQNAIKALVK